MYAASLPPQRGLYRIAIHAKGVVKDLAEPRHRRCDPPFRCGQRPAPRFDIVKLDAVAFQQQLATPTGMPFFARIRLISPMRFVKAAAVFGSDPKLKSDPRNRTRNT